jgi:1-carboxybiuret hydrolase subunit AtzG-like
MLAEEQREQYVETAAAMLSIPLRREWMATVRQNLDVILQHAMSVDGFRLSEDVEPAPTFKP